MDSGKRGSGRHCLQPCKLGHGMSLLCKTHPVLPRQRLNSGVGRGQAQPPHGMAHHPGLLAHHSAAAPPNCSRHVRFCHGSQHVLQTPVVVFFLFFSFFWESRPQLNLQAIPKTWIETDTKFCKKGNMSSKTSLWQRVDNSPVTQKKKKKKHQPSVSHLFTNIKPSSFIFTEQRTNQCPDQPNTATECLVLEV